MKKRIFTLSALGVAVLLSGCPATKTDNTSVVQSPTAIANAAAGTETCMTCHGDSTVLNNKIQNARDGWLNSMHAKGVQVPLVASGTTIGYEWEGSDAFYANGGGCQVCHTKEGFLKKVNGKYDVGSATDSAAAIAADYIQAPTSLTCFTCHTPHTKGNFELVVPASKAVTLPSGGVYNKPKGSVCVDCHQSREPKANDFVLKTLTGTSGVGARFGPHYGNQSDMLLGTGGAQFEGKTYGNGSHTDNAKANCVSCHMTYPEKRFSGSPNLSGHSFNVVGIVHGAKLGNTAGCVTCHPSATATNATATSGHIKSGNPVFKKVTDDTLSTDLNKMLTALVNPADSGNGLLKSALLLESVGGATVSVTFTDNTKISGIVVGQYVKDGKTVKYGVLGDTPAKVTFAKALFNYTFVLEDKSFGVHNSTYAKQLLWDSGSELMKLIDPTVTDAAITTKLGVRP